MDRDHDAGFPSIDVLAGGSDTFWVLQADRVAMNLLDIEIGLGIVFPARHAKAIADDADPIHEACDFLIPTSQFKGLSLLEVNEFLHDPGTCNKWPSFLVAFASNGCGDYFAYDSRSDPATIVYMDPCVSVDENLSQTDGFIFDTFESWYEMKVKIGCRRSSRS